MRFGFSASPKKDIVRALALARKAIAADDTFGWSYLALGSAYLIKREHDKAIAAMEEAVRIQPSDADAHAFLGWYLQFAGRGEEAIEAIKTAMRLNPKLRSSRHVAFLGWAYFIAGRYDDAIATINQRYNILLGYGSPSIHALAAAYAATDKVEKARATVKALLDKRPKLAISTFPFLRLYKRAEDRERFANLLRKAGLPENLPLKRPDKPSIAVLPFTNMSGYAEQEYFADGMTDDLITRISKLSGLIVISRTTSFTFKGKDRKIEDIARELGVQYVLEGSVRRAGGAVRINAQLIDGRTGGHVWAEIFDRPYKDIFALQDEVQGRIVAALKVKLTDEEKQEIARKPTENVEAFDNYLKAERFRLAYSWAETATNSAFTFYYKALALDPEFVAAHIGKARAGMEVWRLSKNWMSSPLRASGWRVN